MTERILVAVDLSETSLAALRAAHQLARARGAVLAVVHVIPQVVDIQALFPQNYAINMNAMAEAERATAVELERQLSELPGSADLPVFVERGEAYAEIIRRAEAWSATLIVVGSYGRGGLARALLGSVAERVVRYAHCPVLVSRPTGQPGLVVAATDLSDPSLPAVARGAEEARQRGARLVVVHAMDSNAAAYLAAVATPFGAEVAVPPVEVRQAQREGLTALLQQAMARYDVAGEPLLLDGAAVPAIVRQLEQAHAELLVVGTHGRTGLSRMALGSVAEQLVRLAPCSVLVVRVSAPG